MQLGKGGSTMFYENIMNYIEKVEIDNLNNS